MYKAVLPIRIRNSFGRNKYTPGPYLKRHICVRIHCVPTNTVLSLTAVYFDNWICFEHFVHCLSLRNFFTAIKSIYEHIDCI